MLCWLFLLNDIRFLSFSFFAAHLILVFSICKPFSFTLVLYLMLMLLWLLLRVVQAAYSYLFRTRCKINSFSFVIQTTIIIQNVSATKYSCEWCRRLYSFIYFCVFIHQTVFINFTMFLLLFLWVEYCEKYITVDVA